MRLRRQSILVLLFFFTAGLSSAFIFQPPTDTASSTVSRNWSYVNLSDIPGSTSFIDWNNSLVAWWRFNNESGENSSFFRDWSPYGNNASCSADNCPVLVMGRFSTALQFDGANDQVLVPDSDSLDIAGPFTIEGWFRPSRTFSISSDYYQALLDKGSYQLFLDKSDGKLKFFMDSDAPKAWSTLGMGMDNGVAALLPYNGSLYAAGWFTTADGVPADGAAVWNGSAWNALYPGFTDSNIESLTIYDGELHAGGWFQTINNISANRAARWNGSTWISLGAGLNKSVYPAAVFNGSLYFGGTFNTAGEVNASRIARWNGSDWSALGSGMNNTVYSLGVWNGSLYAGGAFTVAGSVNATRIARWNGSDWSAFSSGMNNTVVSLSVWNGSLYAGGSFTVAGSVNATRIARWNGTDWSAMGSGLNGTVYSIVSYRGDLYAGGSFSASGNVSVNHTARWNGTDWNSLGGGMDNNVFTLAVWNGQLYASGVFTAVDGLAANRVAKWSSGDERVVSSNTDSWGPSWHYFAVTYNRSSLSLYVDGALQSSVASNISVAANSRPLLLGTSYGSRRSSYAGEGSENFEGLMDEVRIHKRALGPEEIAASFNSTLYPLYHNFTYLPEGNYSYSAYAQDLSGNVNRTEVRVLTVDYSYVPDSDGPVLDVRSPANLTYTSQNVSMDFSVWDQNGVGSCLYELTNSSGSFNLSLPDCQNTTLMGLTQGSDSVKIWSNDSLGYWSSSPTISFYLDSISPAITFVQPTDNGGSIVSRNWSFVNVSVSDLSSVTSFIDWNNSLVGWWRFNNESGETSSFFRDWSSYGNNASCSLCPAIVPGRFGHAIRFNGTGTLSAGNSSIFNASGAFTLEAWFDPPSPVWTRKKPVLIAGSSIGLSDFQVNFTVAYGPEMQADYSDLRFFDSSGAPLPYWLENYSATNATVWVRVPSIPANVTTVLTMYYGNPSAVSASNGSAVFDFFDDFSGGLDKWMLAETSAGYIQVVGGQARLYGNNTWNANGMSSVRNISRPAVLEWYSKRDAIIDSFEGYSVFPPDFGSGLMVKRDSSGSVVRYVDFIGGTVGTHDTSKTLQRIVLKPNGGYLLYWANALVEEDNLWATTDDKFAFQMFSTEYLYVDDVRARKYASLEPVATVGNSSLAGIGRAGSYVIGSNLTQAFGSVNNVSLSAPLLPGWNHILLSYNGSVATLYVNGVLSAQGLSDAASPSVSAFVVGDAAFNGSIDEVRLFDRALSREEVNASFSSGVHRLYHNFTFLSESSYPYNAYAQDAAGNIGQAGLRFLTVNYSYTGPAFPSLAVQSPLNASYPSFSVPLNFTVWDLNDISSCLYELTNSSGSFNVSLPACANATLSGVTEGPNSVRVWANNTAGIWNVSGAVLFIVDVTLPVLSVQVPANTTYSSKSISLNFSAYDANGLSSCLYELANSSGAFNISLPNCQNTTLSGLSDGPNSVRVWANDSAGNSGNSSSIRFTVDLPPSVRIVSPANGSVQVSALVRLNVSVSDSLSSSLNCTLLSDGSLYWQNSSWPAGSNVLVNVSFSEGWHSLNASCRDRSLSSNSSITYFAIDPSTPVVHAVYSVPARAYLNSNVSIYVNASDNVSGVVSVVANVSRPSGISFLLPLYLSGGLWANSTVVGEAGSYNITVNVSNAAGLSSASSFLFHVGANTTVSYNISNSTGGVPPVGISIIAPENNGTLNSSSFSNGTLSVPAGEIIVRIEDTSLKITVDLPVNTTLPVVLNPVLQLENASLVVSPPASSSPLLVQTIVPNVTLYANATIRFNFSFLNVPVPEAYRLRVNKCSIYNSSTGACSGSWTGLTSTVNNATQTISASVDSFSTFMLANRTSICGNGIIESPEQCDGGSSCSASCTSISSSPPPSGGGGGGGSAVVSPAGEGETVLIGPLGSGVLSFADFSGSTVPVFQVGLVPRTNQSNVSVSVKKLGSRPSFVPAVQGKVYDYLEVSSSIAPANLTAATIRFKVNLSWVSSNNFSSSWVSLYRYSGGWNKLPTSSTRSDSSYSYFESASSGFSVFAIVGEKPAPAPVPLAPETKEIPLNPPPTPVPLPLILPSDIDAAMDSLGSIPASSGTKELLEQARAKLDEARSLLGSDPARAKSLLEEANSLMDEARLVKVASPVKVSKDKLYVLLILLAMLPIVGSAYEPEKGATS